MDATFSSPYNDESMNREGWNIILYNINESESENENNEQEDGETESVSRELCRRTSYMCKTCTNELLLHNCFEDYHKKSNS